MPTLAVPHLRGRLPRHSSHRAHGDHAHLQVVVVPALFGGLFSDHFLGAALRGRGEVVVRDAAGEHTRLFRERLHLHRLAVQAPSREQLVALPHHEESRGPGGTAPVDDPRLGRHPCAAQTQRGVSPVHAYFWGHQHFGLLAAVVVGDLQDYAPKRHRRYLFRLPERLRRGSSVRNTGLDAQRRGGPRRKPFRHRRNYAADVGRGQGIRAGVSPPHSGRREGEQENLE
mmetsp:Transcript_12269/g.33090  ORF Transcript_12269/g.33090 Transcript_12269/m.33090 type:complete len:228 (+) Transcript_12269:511-1194(+)